MIKKDMRLLAAITCLTGSGLLIEHLYNYGFDPGDIIGHEWLGFAIEP